MAMTEFFSSALRILTVILWLLITLHRHQDAPVTNEEREILSADLSAARTALDQCEDALALPQPSNNQRQLTVNVSCHPDAGTPSSGHQPCPAPACLPASQPAGPPASQPSAALCIPEIPGILEVNTTPTRRTQSGLYQGRLRNSRLLRRVLERDLEERAGGMNRGEDLDDDDAGGEEPAEGSPWQGAQYPGRRGTWPMASCSTCPSVPAPDYQP